MLLASGKNIARAYGNTLFRVVIGTALNLVFTITLSYGLSREGLKGRTFLTGFVFFTMLFSGGMIPTFILVKGVGLIDSRWAMVLPCLIKDCASAFQSFHRNDRPFLCSKPLERLV